MGFPKPRLVLSSCLNLEPVRYNGSAVEDEFVMRLREYCEVISVCPEVSLGLGVPRDKIILYRENGSLGLSQPSTGLELTQRMREFSERFLFSLPPVDGFLLKGRSPSCGVSRRTLVYRDPEGKVFLTRGRGLFAAEVLRTFRLIPVEDELRLKDRKVKERFLLRLFAAAWLRSDTLNSVHTRYRYLLMAHSERKLRAMEGVLKEDPQEYRTLFLSALRRSPTLRQHIKVIGRMIADVSDRIEADDRERLLSMKRMLGEGKIGLDELLQELRRVLRSSGVEDVGLWTYLSPFPEELIRSTSRQGERT